MLDFLEPIKLQLLLFLIPLAVVLFRAEKNRDVALRFFGIRSGGLSRWRVLFPLILFSLFIFGLSRPYSGYDEVELDLPGRDIMVIFDVSKSMLTDDVPPNRLVFARRKLLDLIRIVEAEHTGDRIGIILFAGQSYLYCPLTSDYNILRVFAKSIQTDLITSSGSAINSAIGTALESIQEVQAVSPFILLVSDGEDDDLHIRNILAGLEEEPFSLHTLGVGTTAGKPIPLPGGRFVKDRKGDVVISQLHESSLKELAGSTGGKYLRARLDDTDLQFFLNSSSSKFPSDQLLSTEKILRVYNEISPHLCGLLLLGLFLLLCFRAERFVFCFAFLLLSSPYQFALAEKTDSHQRVPTVYEAYQAYHQEDYETARLGFEAAHERDPKRKEYLQALASTHFRLGNFKLAQKYFDKASSDLSDGKSTFENLYNAGNAALKTQNPQEAIDRYEKALAIKSKDEKTLFNLEIAKRMLEEQSEQEQKPPPQPSPSPKPSPSSSPQDRSSSSEDEQDSQEQEPSSDNQEESQESSSSDSESPSENQDQETEDAQPQPQEGQETEPQEVSGESSPSTKDPAELREEEAQAWLDSLEDSPVLLQRQVDGKSNSRSQKW